MKRNGWICLFAFLLGCIIINLWENGTGDCLTHLNRYQLHMLYTQGVSEDTYFLHVFFLRMKTILILFVATRIFQKRIVAISFGCLISMMTGMLLCLMLMSNGIWGILLFLGAMLPHGVFYLLAYLYWIRQERKEYRVKTVFIVLLVLLGIACESYVCPFVLESFIKY